MGLEFTICKVRWERYPKVSGNTQARDWLEFQAARGLAANTLDAYGRNLNAFLQFVETRNVTLTSVARNTVGAYIRDVAHLSVPRFSKRTQETTTTLANASLQQHLTVVRLFYDYLVEEKVCLRNPLRPSVNGHGVIRRHQQLPWIPTEEQWRTILEACQQETLRNRTMLALSYDAALRSEEICSLETRDIDPAHRLLRIRLEITKNRRERVIPYSEPSGVLLGQYLGERRKLSRERGPLFLSESYRNSGRPISVWTWSKAIARIAKRCSLPQFTPHTLRHLCLTDVARTNWGIHEIATFAGHRSVQTTALYIHLSGRDLSQKLARGMAEIHAMRMVMISEVLR